ncbi:hypothetical protein [Treponema sp.]|uniref:hypothetical protein n=1 Tax=Treponema sp. TaxID=166 RepID=UPI00298E41FB|nr:hypothetical protein [Treponema sp.]MCQ2241123.1 hypothetical protein [Treponema sp.]
MEENIEFAVLSKRLIDVYSALFMGNFAIFGLGNGITPRMILDWRQRLHGKILDVPLIKFDDINKLC